MSYDPTASFGNFSFEFDGLSNINVDDITAMTGVSNIEAVIVDGNHSNGIVEDVDVITIRDIDGEEFSFDTFVGDNLASYVLEEIVFNHRDDITI